MSDNVIWQITNSVWRVITKSYEDYRSVYSELIFHDDMKEQFDVLYKEKYMEIKKRFMTDETNELDSHKQAAILTICCLKLNIIECPEAVQSDAGNLHILPQIIAINVGLSYMLKCLNDLLQEKKVKRQIKQYYFPVAFACDTPYEKIICRILYLEQHESDMAFNVLELADTYFLLEYINLLQHGIEPSILIKGNKIK